MKTIPKKMRGKEVAVTHRSSRWDAVSEEPEDKAKHSCVSRNYTYQIIK